MTWTPIVNKPFQLDWIKPYLDALDFSSWKPSLIVWHNTAAPTLAQWQQTADQDQKAGRPRGQTRINNLVSYFRDGQKWSSGPHWFVADDLCWAFTPSNHKGTHSPSWNGISIGIEMVADFDHEDPSSGGGLKVKNNCIALTAMLCERLGLDPQTQIKMHYEDKKTTHACPGKLLRDHEADMIDAVLEYMGHAGGHGDAHATTSVAMTFTPGDTLNLRSQSSISGKIIVALPDKTPVKIINSAMNGNTKWLFVETQSEKQGWVSARYVKEK